MIKSIQTSALVLAILAAAPALALDGWSPGPITDIRIQKDRVLIKQKSALNPGNCPSAEYFMMSLDWEDGNEDRGLRIIVSLLNSLLLTAHQGIEFGLEGCAPYPVIVEMNINDGRGR
jgi:hypothetical protein